MTRKYFAFVLIVCGGFAQAVHAATAASAMSEVEVLHYLTPAQQTQWNDAQKELKDGQVEMQEGNALKATPVSNTPAGGQLEQDPRKEGDAKVKEATAKMKEANATLAKLRKTAQDIRDAARAQAAQTAAASLKASLGQWPEASQTLPAQIANQLWDAKYTRLYFGGVYAFENGKYVAKPALAAQINAELLKLDQSKRTLSDSPADAIKLGQDNGKLVIDYPNRASDLANNIKSALIVGEVLYESDNGYAAFSLRAVDMANMHVIANQVMMLSVEPSMAKMLGLPAFKVRARREEPAAAADASATKPADDNSGTTPAPAAAPAEAPPALMVNLQDPNDTLAAFKKPTYVFRMASNGGNTLENRFASLMVKSYFRAMQPDIIISDQDFLAMALPAAAPDAAKASPADVNTAWVLPNVPSLDFPTIELDALVARDLAKNAEVKIGKVAIDRTLPKQNLPTAAELRAGGY